MARLAVEPAELELGYSEVRHLELSWQLLAPLAEGGEVSAAGEMGGAPRVFVHLVDSPGEVLRTYDHEFPVDWRPDEEVRYEIRVHQSALGPPLAAGTYDLTAGLYDDEGRRWPLAVEGEAVDHREYRVATIEVSPPLASPVFRFSDSWRPVESGLDRQVLGRRWLVGAGSIWITRAAEVRSVWMEVLIPSPQNGLSRLVLEEGEREPMLLVVSTCGGAEIALTGSGRHGIEVPVGTSGEEATPECEIVLRPNYHLLLNGSLERRSILLENLAWSANGRH